MVLRLDIVLRLGVVSPGCEWADACLTGVVGTDFESMEPSSESPLQEDVAEEDTSPRWIRGV